MFEQKVAKVTKGRNGFKAEEDQGGRSRERFECGWRISPGGRQLKTAKACRIIALGNR